jgi:hypothetical protein
MQLAFIHQHVGATALGDLELRRKPLQTAHARPTLTLDNHAVARTDEIVHILDSDNLAGRHNRKQLWYITDVALRQRLVHGPAATAKLDGEPFRRYLTEHVVLHRSSPDGDLDRLLFDRVCVTQLFQKRIGLGPGELAGRLPLGEAHRTARIAKVTVAGSLQEGQQLLDLPRGRRWALLLSKCHGMQSCRSSRHSGARRNRSMPSKGPVTCGETSRCPERVHRGAVAV